MERIIDYSSLVLAVRDLVDLEISDSLDAYIQLTEQTAGRVLTSAWQEYTENVPVTVGGTYFATDRRGILRISVDGRPLERMTDEAAQKFYERWTPGEPHAYSVLGAALAVSAQQRVRFWPPPPDDATYRADIAYKIVIPALTAANPINWLIDVAPDVYLYGTAVHAVTYNGDTTNLPLYQRLFDTALASVQRETDEFQSLDSSVSPATVDGYAAELP